MTLSGNCCKPGHRVLQGIIELSMGGGNYQKFISISHSSLSFSEVVHCICESLRKNFLRKTLSVTLRIGRLMALACSSSVRFNVALSTLLCQRGDDPQRGTRAPATDGNGFLCGLGTGGMGWGHSPRVAQTILLPGAIDAICCPSCQMQVWFAETDWLIDLVVDWLLISEIHCIIYLNYQQN